MPGILAIILACPLDHVGVFAGLTVDRPRVTMVVRRGYPRLVVDVRKNLKAEFRVFVEDFQPAWYAIATILLDEILVGEQTFEILADLFASRRARIA